jgi:hypothetical protein
MFVATALSDASLAPADLRGLRVEDPLATLTALL